MRENFWKNKNIIRVHARAENAQLAKNCLMTYNRERES